ncbi:retinoblastoma-associated protein [Caerostris darwini]|uniref:Retinoblastoma-associated protein n=1 Tax=Caerostris darwini TaxID=1538125 RepID=A0AAV4UKN8_9ARAC|nr:retinoblastoma-associated protein [Caerostris darwini]
MLRIKKKKIFLAFNDFHSWLSSSIGLLFHDFVFEIINHCLLPSMETIIQDFQQFSFGLHLSSPALDKATKFLNDIKTFYFECGQKISKEALFACAVFVSVQNTFSTFDSDHESNNSQPEITVSQLLEKADINIMDFFTVTCFLKKNCTLSENVKQNLIALERKYLIVSALFDKFESMSSEIFHVDVASPIPLNQPSPETNCLLKKHKALCWMLFLVAKAKVLWHRQELLATFHLLLCCIGEVARVTPSFMLLPPFDRIVAKNEGSSTILEVLSNHFRTKFEEVKAVYDGWLHVASELNIGSKLPEVQELQAIYSQLYIQSGDVDESLFLERDWHLLPSVSEQNHSPRKYSSTLIRRTLDTSEALNTILLSAPDGLTENLKFCLQKCSVDASNVIQDFLNQSKAIFIKEFVKVHEGGDRNLAERRYQLASRFYYLMLDALLKKEAERLTAPAFTSFIQNIVFHKSLLACCLEVTLMSCGSIGPVNFTPISHGNNFQAQGVVFPWVLRVFGLEAFDFFKIIESFIRGAPTITMQIINHLKFIEDKILGSLAWTSGSPVFGGLSGSGCSPCCKAKYSSPKPSESSYWSPNKDPSQINPSTPHACHAVSLFLNKVCRLAYQQLEKMCARLHIEKELQAEIWISIEHVLYRKNHLLQDRHLDQIIMCCIFAVCKAKDHEVRFKTILSCYDQLPYASVSVYKQVLTGGRKDFIIKFYNMEFYSEMKSFVLSRCGNKSDSSLIVSQSPMVLSPFYSLPSKKNIFISPLQESPFKNPNEVIYRKLPSYTFGSSQSTKMLQDINISLNKLPVSKEKDKSTSSSKKRLQFDSEDMVPKVTLLSARKCLKFDDVESGSAFKKPKLM